jgi:DNA (cytosine-5)-methyltransferase 1
MTNEIIVDFFAGGGGASQGIYQALGRHVDVAVNHDPEAIAMHKANHPQTRHFTENVWRVRPHDVTQGRPVGLFWASPDCTHFSKAKGGKPVKKEIRSLAWIVPRFCAVARPRVVILENVAEFEGWGPVVPLWLCRASGCGWKGTEGQANLAAGHRHRRACPRCDGRRLQQTAELVPDAARKGTTFRRWWRKMETLGYVGERRVIDFAVWGAPTHRKRLLVVFRRDGRPIVWPEPKYAAPEKVEEASLLAVKLRPYRVAAECIDWSLPITSIFDRPKPLADATLRRIAHGTVKYVLTNPRPYIVGVGGRMGQTEPADVLAPQNTVTGKNDRAIIVPSLFPLTHHGEARGSSFQDPMPTITGANRGEQAIMAASMIRYNGEKGTGANVHGLDAPVPVIPTENRFGLMAAMMVQTGYGERAGQSPRSLNIEKPLGAAVGGGKHALVAAFMEKYYGGKTSPGADLRKPGQTITTSGHEALVAASLVHLNRGDNAHSAADEPLRAILAGANHAGLVYAFMVKYYGQSIGQPLTDPMGAATTKDRFGLVLARALGETWVIVDLLMRMLVPRELARGQSFPDSYILTGTKSSQVKKIGNSVPPVGAEEMVRANCSDLMADVR